MEFTLRVCPFHSNGGPGHDDSFPTRTLMLSVNFVVNVVDNSDCEGRNGPVEIYVCGALIETGWWKVIMKRQMSCILSRTVESAS